jgi:cell division protease FtsH
MVCMFGMSETVGLAHYGQKMNPFLAQAMQDPMQRDCSEATAREIDIEVKQILDRCYAEATEILTVHRDQLERVTSELLKGETLDRATFYRLIERDEPPITRVAAPVEHREPAPAT